MYNYQQSLIRVNGLDGAKTYPLYPNSTVALFDANEDIMYVKSCDMAGFQNIRTFKFEEVFEREEQKSNYVSREEMEAYVKYLISQQPESEPESNTKRKPNANDK